MEISSLKSMLEMMEQSENRKELLEHSFETDEMAIGPHSTCLRVETW